MTQQNALDKKNNITIDSNNNSTNLINHTWHALDTTEVLDIINVNMDNGLHENEVMLRQQKYGSNILLTHKQQNLFVRFLRQFNNILIYILLLSAVIAGLMQRWVDMAVILGVIILNAIFGFLQEGKAEKALSAIRDILAPQAKVIRNGQKLTILASELVPGDIVLIERGDKIPADLRILSTRGLCVQESILTGEAHPIEKTNIATAKKAILAERISIAYSGTMVTQGSGTGVVVATGLHTEIGKISNMLNKVTTPTTPLLQQMNRFGYWLTGAILLLGLITFLVGYFVWNDASQEMFMAIVGIIVAAVPEGLPPILTIILALGVTRMAKRHAIIRRLPAVETMGAVTTICSDKTGTLTLNELTVANLVTAQNNYAIVEDSMFVNGTKHEELIQNEHYDFDKALLGGILCNDAELTYSDGHFTKYGDPLDLALLMLSYKAKRNFKLLQKMFPRTDLIPYESEHKLMATLHHDHEQGKAFIYVKGASEHILTLCKDQQSQGIYINLDINFWHKKITELAKHGEKVLAIAIKEVPLTHTTITFSDIKDLSMLALFGFIDPPRQEAKNAIAVCHGAGINVKMITGDHALTAEAIAKDLGIIPKDELQPKILSGHDIEAMSDKELQSAVLHTDVYARTTPEHKLRLVKSLQNAGQIVAMTGDGVNDAPALRQADIGVAMGAKGTEIAKEASEMVLTDDNFVTIANAVEEGRTIYENLKKTILYVLPTSVAQAFVVVVAIFLGWQSPITPVQILWVNMITSVTLSLALGFEPPSTDVMHHPPRKKNQPLLSMFLAWRVAFVSALLVIAVFIVANIEQKITGNIILTRTSAVNMIVVAEIMYLFNCRKIYTSAINKEAFLGSKPTLIAIASVIILQLLFTYMPIMQKFFGTTSLDIAHWLRIVILSIAVFLLIEFEKIFMRIKNVLRVA